jgi:hypothetical protein
MKRFLTAVAGFAIMAGTSAAIAQQPSVADPHASGALKQNQTQGYGAGKVLNFSYTQNFVCVDQPKSDLNFNKVQADADSAETQAPICQAGTDPTINPPGLTGKATGTTDPIYVLVPMFSVDNDQNPNDAIDCAHVVRGTLCSKQLGTTLIKLFGAVPEGFKETPKVFTQCPDGGLPPGTCTMHASQVDLAPVLAELGYITNPPTANVFWLTATSTCRRNGGRCCRCLFSMPMTGRRRTAVVALHPSLP